ncbi:MAB_1171c family putative transporter [Streptomyces sp. 8N706]|uniref:MAB_1171c family putative transporter n=1 Tax=Streptomyces sp. 8N706 TaxID=3457416 RepID=UPI003FD2ED84
MTTLYDVLAFICTVAGLAAFCYKVPELMRRRTDPALWALALYFLSSGLSYVIDLNWLRNDVSELFGYVNITSLLTQSLVVILTAAQQVLLIHWSHPPEQARITARRRILVFCVALAVLVTLFFAIDPYRQDVRAQGALPGSMHNVQYASYTLFYITICAVGQVETVRLSARYARLAHRSSLRVGMWAVAAGATLVLAYCLIRYIQIIGTQLGFDMGAWDPASWLAGDVGSLLQLFGWTFPSWGETPSAWVANCRAYTRLRPLWWAMYEAMPVIALEPPPKMWLDCLPGNLEYRLYRRVIEILDGYLELRPYLSDVAAQRGIALREMRNSPQREASFLHAALKARAEAVDAARPAEVTSVKVESVRPISPSAEGFEEEKEWLTQVAKSFTRLTP